MSTLPENELDLDKLFLPAWAQGTAATKQYANYEAREERPDRRGDRPGQGGGRPQPRRDQNRPAGGRPGGPGGSGRPGFGGPSAGGPRRDGDRNRSGGQGGRPPRFDQRDQRNERPRQEAPAQPPELNTSFTPEEKGVESLARQIKMSGRAYPLFDIARLILEKPERHAITFSVKKKADGQVALPLFFCALDETLWLSENEAVAHVLRKHFGTFYQAERTATEPPKGTYTFVAQCGLSGAILGPPNHHDYQNQLHKLHAARFARMPFDVFKSNVKIVRDEEVVKKWVEDQSWKTEFVCLNVPEALRLPNRDEVEKHFRSVHKETIIKSVESHTLNGKIAREAKSPEMIRFTRYIWEDQRRFPLQIATTLSQQFARHGLQFFKVNKTVTHVSVARPSFLDLETTPVSETIKRIVEFINATPKCTRRKLFEALAPAAAKPAVAVPTTTEPAAVPTEAAPAPAAAEPTSEQTAVNADLHWLIHQGHVIEFANGILETAKKPLPKPPKQPKAAKPGAKVEATAATAEAAESSTEPEAIGGEALPDAELPVAEAAPAVEQPAPTAPPAN